MHLTEKYATRRISLLRQLPRGLFILQRYWRPLRCAGRLQARFMSIGAAQHEIVDIHDDIESPQQNNGAMDESNVSLQLPDLTDVLAAFSKKEKKGKRVSIDSPSKATDETRAFGTSIAHFNHLQEDGSVAKPVARRTSNAKSTKQSKVAVVKEKKAKVVKTPKESTAKKPPKKALTITERAVAPFLPPADLPRPSAAADKSILDFLSPTKEAPVAITPDTTAKKRAKPGSKPKSTTKRKSTAKVDQPAVLSTPRTARNNHSAQVLVYAEQESPVQNKTYALNPSKLITLSKGLFSKANRGPENELTDGGIDACISNQEEADNIKHQDLQNPTMHLSTQANHTDLTHGIEGATRRRPSLDLAESPVRTPVDDDTTVLKEYLRQLVDGSDDDMNEAEFPISPIRVPAHIRSDTVESLRDLLETKEEPHIIDLHSDTPVPSSGSQTKRMRGSSNSPRRKVAAKLSLTSSPRPSNEVLLISSSAEVHPPPPITGSEMPTEVQTTIERANTTISSSAKPAIPHPISSQSNQDTTFSTTVNTKLKPGKRKGKATAVVEPSATTLDLTNTSRPVIEDKMNTRPWQDSDDDYWIIPDSEDEVVETALQQSPSATKKSKAMTNRPNFEGYPLAKLQTELSRFGFKPSKNRAGMIDLLNKCWDAKANAANEAIAVSHATTHAPKTASDKDQAEQQRPCIDLLNDSGTTAGSQPGSKSAKKLETAAEKAARLRAAKEAREVLKAQTASEKEAKKLADDKAKKDSKAAKKEAARLASIEATKDLHAKLTHVLRVDNSDHQWWHKILTYEPIVLEDLTEWLATHRGIEAEVDDVRDYFDLKGVCCAKRITRAGKGRRRL